jgi:hypothetical protein
MCTPILVALNLSYMTHLGNLVSKHGIVDSPILQIGEIPMCRNPSHHNYNTDEPCLSVGYSMVGPHDSTSNPAYDRYHDLMKIMAKNNKFQYGKDVRPISAGKSKDIYNYLDRN